jgi:hypothetical protein
VYDVKHVMPRPRPTMRISTKLSREKAAITIQRAMKRSLARAGYYRRRLHAHREIESPDKEPLIDITIGGKRRPTPSRIEEQKKLVHSPG